MLADLISTNDPRWVQFLERVPHDVYHRPEYSGFAAEHEGGVPLAFYARRDRREMLIPLLLRRLPPELEAPAEWKDASSPYGYPAPLTSDPDDDQWLQECRAALYTTACEHDIVSAFVRLHPLRGLPAERLAGFGTVVEHGPVVYIDLTQDADALVTHTRLNHRRDIQRLLREGFSARMDDWSVYSAFGSLYRATMDRVAAERFYYFSDEYFSDLALMLEGRLHLCAVFARDGQVAAAGLFTETDGLIQYHLGGTLPAFLRCAPSKLMFDTVRTWGKGIGARAFHLGGGTSAHRDSLFQFKAGFSRSRGLFHTLRMVFNDDRYSRLAGRWSERWGSGAPSSDYFPAYRKAPGVANGGVQSCTTPHTNV